MQHLIYTLLFVVSLSSCSTKPLGDLPASDPSYNLASAGTATEVTTKPDTLPDSKSLLGASIEEAIDCDFVYDTITSPNYRMHLRILDKYHHPEKRVYDFGPKGDTLNHFLVDQDIGAFANSLDSTERGLYRALTNKVVFLILEHEPKMLDYGLTQWIRVPGDLDYFMYHVAHPMCNTFPIDSLIGIIKTDMGEPHEGAKEVKKILLNRLERARTRQ